jgi:signal transduction histidine kinase
MAEPIRWRDRLGSRLGVAFVLTALLAVGVAVGVALTTTGASIDRLVADQRAQTVLDVQISLAAAYADAGCWATADLLPAHALAAAGGAVLRVTTTEDDEVPVPPEADRLTRRLHRHERAPTGPGDDPRHEHQPPAGPQDNGAERDGHHSRGGASAPLMLGGPVGDDTDDGTSVDLEEERMTEIRVADRVVGVATLAFVTRDQPDPVTALRDAVVRNVLLAGALAVLLGVVITGWVSPRLTRPLRSLTAAVGRIADGDRVIRSRVPGAVGELELLARSVDRMAADLEREDRLRRALVADVAHEVRTPLTVLLGEVEALEDGVVAPDPERLASLHEEVLRLAALVEDLDAIAAAEAAGRSLDREPVDLAAVAAAALRGLEEQVAEAGIELETQLTQVTVLGDRRRLEQVVRNLLANAVKFSPSGGRIAVRVDASDDDAVLTVVDDGPGIPEAELPHVFERFWRGRAAAGTAGSGVGLAVVAELVAAHGGVATADNARGGGARLTVRLPRADAPTSGSASTSSHER